MRLAAYLFSIIVALAILTGNTIYASEAVNKGIVNPPSVSAGGASKISPEKTAVTEPQKTEAGKQAEQKTIQQKPLKHMSIGDLIFKMLKALAGVLALIIGLAFIINLIKGLKSRQAENHQQNEPAEEAHKEPTTISEAVASFVKHRLKK